MATAYDTLHYEQYFLMAGDNLDPLEAQLHQELYGEDPMFIPLTLHDLPHSVEAENEENPDSLEDVLYGEEERLAQVDALPPPAVDGHSEPVQGAKTIQVLGPAETTTAHEGHDADLLEDDEQEFEEEETVAPTNDVPPAAQTVGPSTLPAPSSPDAFDTNSPALHAYLEEASQPCPMLIVLPGREDPFHLCSSEEPSVLASRQDLYRRSIAELFAALRIEPLMRDRFKNDWKEMTLSIPALELVLHEDDPYSYQFSLEQFAALHLAFCPGPVTFVLDEQYRFEYRLQPYQTEMQRRLNAGENIAYSEPFNPESVILPAIATPSTVTNAGVHEEVAEVLPEVEDEYYVEEDDQLENSEALHHREAGEADANYDDTENDEAFYQDEEGNVHEDYQHYQPQPHLRGILQKLNENDAENDHQDEAGIAPAVSKEQVSEPHQIESETQHQIDITEEEVYQAPIEVVRNGVVEEPQEGYDNTADDDGRSIDEGEVEEESFVRVETVDISDHDSDVEGLVEEPEEVETNTDGDYTEKVEYEYVDEDGTVLVQGYDTIAALDDYTAETTVEEPGVTALPTNAPDESPELLEGAGLSFDHQVDDTLELPTRNDVTETLLDEFDLEAALSDEYHPVTSKEIVDDEIGDHLAHLQDDTAFNTVTTQLEAVPEDYDDYGLAATQDGAAAAGSPADAENDQSPISVSGVKRAWETVVDDENDELGGHDTSDSHKRPRVA
ncbi:hypothetical protein DACRYDRAFT_24445 [Dacryopinax primogenitus]|uniref:Uncharacterized protein n=1 Tax=Dacryopinax primogenitus (strain DJM 731) TaxID=1858805 RepID=M5FXW6_DACPD|nr:uncharacterized protein DACRYDRAFT_24445 [Dacryopinax primogenitus]EJT98386.1 hypothetical protein DACRYDRAFT_24445 [Dacryopinax primogenitus]